MEDKVVHVKLSPHPNLVLCQFNLSYGSTFTIIKIIRKSWYNCFAEQMDRYGLSAFYIYPHCFIAFDTNDFFNYLNLQFGTPDFLTDMIMWCPFRNNLLQRRERERERQTTVVFLQRKVSQLRFLIVSRSLGQSIGLLTTLKFYIFKSKHLWKYSMYKCKYD